MDVLDWFPLDEHGGPVWTWDTPNIGPWQKSDERKWYWEGQPARKSFFKKYNFFRSNKFVSPLRAKVSSARFLIEIITFQEVQRSQASAHISGSDKQRYSCLNLIFFFIYLVFANTQFRRIVEIVNKSIFQLKLYIHISCSKTQISYSSKVVHLHFCWTNTRRGRKIWIKLD